MLNWIKSIATFTKDRDKENAKQEEKRIPVAVVVEESEAYKKQGNALLAQGKLEAAAECYRQALQVNPQFKDACLNLGYVLLELERLQEAREWLQKAISLDQNFADAWYFLGVIAQKDANPAEASLNFSKAIQIQPKFDHVYKAWSEVFSAQGEQAKARGILLQGVACNSESIELMIRLGALYPSGLEAEQAIAGILGKNAAPPDYAMLHAKWAAIYVASGRQDAAIASYKKALSLKPDFAALHYNLGNVLKDKGDLRGAMDCYERALVLAPEDADTHNNMGNVLMLSGELESAIAHYRKVTALKPDFYLGFSNLGLTLQQCGQLEQAIACFRQALSLNPEFLECYSYLLFALSFHEKCSPVEYLTEARRFGGKALALARPYDRWPILNPATAGQRMQKLRVGLVSGDLRDHAVGHFLDAIIANLDPSSIELVAYLTHAEEDALSARIKPHFAAWHVIAPLNNEAAARKIHQDGIHVLIDLSGHTRYNRLAMFAWKPAPVQLSWLGYLASTGVPGMDYLLADAVTVPKEHQDQFTEAIWRMPDTVNCYTPPYASPRLATSALPATSKGFVTFACFQNLHKINDEVLKTWAAIFQALPQARLHLQNKLLHSQTVQEELLQRLANVGIDRERVTLIGPIPGREDYLALHADADIMLDTFPYPGITTTCEALWMGVPVITLAGGTLLARQGASLMACAGLHDWVADTADEYVRTALRHAADLERLAQVRAGLRATVLASPLFDAPLFARNLKEALHQMWIEKTAMPGQSGMQL